MIDNMVFEIPFEKSNHVCLKWDYLITTEHQDKYQQEGKNIWNGEKLEWETNLRSATVEEAWMIFRSRTSILINDHVSLMKERKASAKSPWLTTATLSQTRIRIIL